MMTLIKGYTYLIRCDKKWYIVSQSGQKTWNAIVFTHSDVNWNEAYVSGNSMSIVDKLEALCVDDKPELVRAHTTVQLRKFMFSILKYGDIREGL